MLDLVLGCSAMSMPNRGEYVVHLVHLRVYDNIRVHTCTMYRQAQLQPTNALAPFNLCHILPFQHNSVDFKLKLECVQGNRPRMEHCDHMCKKIT